MRTRSPAFLCGAVLLAHAIGIGPADAAEPIVLACDIPAAAETPSSVAGERIFRFGAGSVQEWNASQERFGTNLCGGVSCAKTAGRLEASIGTASLIYTVGLIQETGEGYWRVVGASGLAVTQGNCRIVPEPRPLRP